MADVFENFRNMCLEINELDHAILLSTPGLMVEKIIREIICHSIYRHAKANNKYMKIMITVKNRHIFNIGM